MKETANEDGAPALESPVDDEKVALLPAGDAMTVEQALSYALKAGYKDVVVAGFHHDGDIMVYSSKMTREYAFWILEHAKLHAMDRL